MGMIDSDGQLRLQCVVCDGVELDQEQSRHIFDFD